MKSDSLKVKRKIRKILIANRGEIAVRIIRACKKLGIKSVAVYSEVDESALHTRLADEKILIGEAAASQSYLDMTKIISTAKQCNADAIHPGYGFLSENSKFISEVENAGIIFIGPSAKSVEMMGSKTAARELMKKNKVPIVPGTTTPIKSITNGLDEAKKIGFPVLLKASAGGGGKGMKKVFTESEFENAFTSAQREALKAFGDDAVYIEKLIENPKHIEVQIIGDKHGNYAHLFERECSTQRRHQKIIEEAPSIVVDEATRAKLTEAAVNAAKACGYYNAGTIEFLMDEKKNFYFLEMNTRLQVEHPVTEMITGVDLVQEQINIAEGMKLSFAQNDLMISGHSIECRIYAEDPETNFLPTTGKIKYHQLPHGSCIRCDEGIDALSEVNMFYDPLLTKIIVHADDRHTAIEKMKFALKNYFIAGVKTNITSLLWILDSEKFCDGSYSINFLENEFVPLLPNEYKTKMLEATAASAIFFSYHHWQNHLNGNGLNKIESEVNNRWLELMNE